jgi:hypothetical protein
MEKSLVKGKCIYFSYKTNTPLEYIDKLNNSYNITDLAVYAFQF